MPGNTARLWSLVVLVCALASYGLASAQSRASTAVVGEERAVPRHLKSGEEFRLSIRDLVAFGHKLFVANWTDQDGGGRPLSKGTGQPLTDRSQPLTGERAFNRL